MRAIHLENADVDPHSVTVRVTGDNEVLLGRSYYLEPGGEPADHGRRIPVTEWGGATEPFTVSARLDDATDRALRSITAGSYYDTLTVGVVATGDLSITVSDR